MRCNNEEKLLDGNKTKKMQEDKVNLVKNVTDYSASCGQDLVLSTFPL